MMQMKSKKVRLSSTNIFIGIMWLIVFTLTGVICYTYVYGGSAEQKKSNTQVTERKGPVDVFFGRTIIGIGDSIMYGKGTDGYTVANQIADKHNMTAYDFSQSGATITCYDRDNPNKRYNIYEQVREAASTVEHADYIVFNGSTNDLNEVYNNKLGTITEDFDTPRDLNTFCGAMEEIIYMMKTSYPKALIVYVRVHNMKRRDYEEQLNYGEVAEQICKKWGIGVADIFNDSGMNTFLKKYTQYTLGTNEYPEGDYVHPTKEGYDLFYIPYIEEAFEKMYRKKNN